MDKGYYNSQIWRNPQFQKKIPNKFKKF